jgi:glycosyltransferase involved in cell wall biosynthesis
MRRRFARPDADRFNADRLVNRLWDYPRYVRRLAGFDVFHVMDHSYAQLVHYLPADRTLVTCHDTDTFRCLFEPEAEPRPLWFRQMAGHILRGLQKAALVVCVSESTRRQIVRYGIVRAEKIAVVWNGVHPAFLTASVEGDHAGSPGAGANELLHVGSTIPRKRIDVLFRVFAECRRIRPELRLVHAGTPFTPEQNRMARSLRVDDAIVCLEFLDAPRLAEVYRRAALTLIPSEAEGFGLPLAESMACGTPVVASDIPALREVGGDAAIYCRVGDISGWAERILDMHQERTANPESWERRVGLCRSRAKSFSWDRNAREIGALHRTIVFKTNRSACPGKLLSPEEPGLSGVMRPAATCAKEITLF